MNSTQNEMVADYLERGIILDPEKARKYLKCDRLAARIWDLKQQGYGIATELIVNHRTKKRHAEYSLISKPTRKK